VGKEHFAKLFGPLFPIDTRPDGRVASAKAIACASVTPVRISVLDHEGRERKKSRKPFALFVVQGD